MWITSFIQFFLEFGDVCEDLVEFLLFVCDLCVDLPQLQLQLFNLLRAAYELLLEFGVLLIDILCPRGEVEELSPIEGLPGQREEYGSGLAVLVGEQGGQFVHLVRVVVKQRVDAVGLLLAGERRDLQLPRLGLELLELADEARLLLLEVRAECGGGGVRVVDDLRLEDLHVFLEEGGVGLEGADLLAQGDVLAEELLELGLLGLRGRAGLPRREGELRDPLLQLVDLPQQLLVQPPVFLDRTLEVLPLLLHLAAELSDRGVVGVDSLFLLPEVVLHRGDLVLDFAAVLDLFEDAGFLCAAGADLCFEGGDGGGMVEVGGGLLLDLDLVGHDAHFEVVDAVVLLCDELGGEGFDVDWGRGLWTGGRGVLVRGSYCAVEDWVLSEEVFAHWVQSINYSRANDQLPPHNLNEDREPILLSSSLILQFFLPLQLHSQRFFFPSNKNYKFLFHIMNMKRGSLITPQSKCQPWRKYPSAVLRAEAAAVFRPPTPENPLAIALSIASALSQTIVENAEAAIDRIESNNFISRIQQATNQFEAFIANAFAPSFEDTHFPVNSPQEEPMPTTVDNICGGEKQIQKKMVKREGACLSAFTTPLRELKQKEKLSISSKDLLLGQKRGGRSELVPLTSVQCEQDVRSTLLQTFYRDKFAREDEFNQEENAPKPELTRLFRKVNPRDKEQFAFDYDGEKIPITNSNSLKNNPVKVLKTVYKVHKDRADLRHKKAHESVRFGRFPQVPTSHRFLQNEPNLHELKRGIEQNVRWTGKLQSIKLITENEDAK